MMAKYNLLVGEKIEKIKVDVDNWTDFREYLETLPYVNPYYDEIDGKIYYQYYITPDETEYYIILGERINTDRVLQDEKAKAFVGNYKNNNSFPFYGVVDRLLYMEFDEYIYDALPYTFTEEQYTAYENNGLFLFENPLSKGFTTEELAEYIRNILEETGTPENAIEEAIEKNETYRKDSFFTNTLLDYKDELKDIGLENPRVEIPSIYDIDEVIFNIGGEHLPIDDYFEYYKHSLESDFQIFLFHIDNIKQYLPKGYSWLYETTYFTSTSYKDSSVYGTMFISTKGDICTTEQCGGDYPFITGIRPVVTINTSDVQSISTSIGETVNKIDNPVTSDIIKSIVVILIFSASMFLISKTNLKKQD
jgi:hypothetical protein